MHRSGTGAREVDLLLQVRLAAKAEVDRIPGLDVGGSPMGAIAHLVDGGFGRAD